MNRIEYHRPTVHDQRRKAGFWLGAGNFLVTAAAGYAAVLAIGFFAGFVFFIKILSLACG